MGSGLSSSHHRSSGASSSLHEPAAAPAPAPALVVAADGSLREFVTPAAAPLLLPVSVSDVLGANADDGDDDHGRYFVCSSSALYFEADVPALGASELLRPGQLYFVLPAAMLGRPLSGADMAALAVRASQALAAGARPRGGHGRRPRGPTRARVVPAAAAHHAHGDEEAVNEKLNQRTLGGFETAPPRGPARKPAVAARPAPPVTVRRALSTIEEGAE